MDSSFPLPEEPADPYPGSTFASSPFPKIIGIVIAGLTLILPMLTIIYYSSEQVQGAPPRQERL